jgi:hypothetical protein
VLRDLIAQGIQAGLSRFVTGPVIDTVFGGVAGAAATYFGGARAMGGAVNAGMSYIVGEGGEAEVFTPGVGGTVTPMSRAAGGGGGVRIGTVNLGAGASPQSVAALARWLQAVNQSIEPRSVAANGYAGKRSGRR